MATIKHLFHINAPQEKVFEALTTVNGLSNWWTVATSGETKKGGILQFRFGEFVNEMKVMEQKKV